MVSTLTTHGLRQSRQYEHWREAVRATHAAWDMPRRTSSGFRGWVTSRKLGPAQVLACACEPCEGYRGPTEISRADTESVGVLFVFEGQEHLRAGPDRLLLGAGQFALWNTTRPIGFEVVGHLRKLTLMLPAELAARLPEVGHIDRTYDARRGCAALLSAQLQALTSLPGELDAEGQQAVLRGAVDLLAATIGAQSPRACTQTRRLVSRAEAWIGDHLAEPDLDVARVAAALGVSRRHLDRSFARVGRSTHRTIWGERLTRCRSDILMYPSDSLSEIAFRWGFSDAAHFSRSFRATFGESPSQFRRSRSKP